MNEREIAKLYRDAAKEEPSASVDSAILAAAHRGAGAMPRRARSRTWGVPLAAAAVLVLSATLVFLVQREEPLTSPEAQEQRSERDARVANQQPHDEERPAAAPPLADASSRRDAEGPMATAPHARYEREQTESKSASGITGATKVQEAPSTAAAAAREDSNVERNPKEWLARIERLRAEGKIEEARKNLVEFKERYPQYPLPPWTAEE